MNLTEAREWLAETEIDLKMAREVEAHETSAVNLFAQFRAEEERDVAMTVYRRLRELDGIARSNKLLPGRDP